MDQSNIETFIARLPKVELHVHLEGAIRPETLRALSRRKGRFEMETEEWIRERNRGSFRYANFQEFITAFKLLVMLLESPSDYALATTQLLEWLAEQNVKYAEITLSAGVILWKKQALDRVFEAISEAVGEAGARLGIRVNWIFDAVRQFGADHAREVVKWAARFRPHGVVAFGIGGDEEQGPVEHFRDVFREAHDLGLRVTAHAGETSGPESIRKAVELLRAERIGHALTAARDPAVMALLRERGIPVEVCLSSNVSIGLIKRLEDHPLPEFLRAGLVVTLNSDDPAMFGTSLEREFALAAEHFALSREQICGLCENAIRAAFLSQQEKRSLLRELAHAAALEPSARTPRS